MQNRIRLLQRVQAAGKLKPEQQLELEQLLHQQMANEMRMPEGVTAPETEQLFDAEPFDSESFETSGDE